MLGKRTFPILVIFVDPPAQSFYADAQCFYCFAAAILNCLSYTARFIFNWPPFTYVVVLHHACSFLIYKRAMLYVLYSKANEFLHSIRSVNVPYKGRFRRRHERKNVSPNGSPSRSYEEKPGFLLGYRHVHDLYRKIRRYSPARMLLRRTKRTQGLSGRLSLLHSTRHRPPLSVKVRREHTMRYSPRAQTG